MTALALGGLLAVASLPAEEGPMSRMEMQGVEIVIHEGAQVVQRVRAENARLAPSGEAIDAFNVVVEVHDPESGEVIHITSPRGRIFHAVLERADDSTEREPTALELVTLAGEILRPGDAGPRPAMVRRSDFLLFADEEDGPMSVVAQLGERGSVRATTVYWGGHWQKFISLGPFEQLTTEDGETIRLTGTGFYTEMSFSYWDYFTLDGVGTRFELVPAEDSE